MTILVTGRAGQLAIALATIGGPEIRVAGRSDFNFDKPETIDALFTHPPSLVINTAAWTAVDEAEDDPAAAARANHDGPARFAQCCRQRDIPLIHVSTDYVFDGTKATPYLETDPTGPTGVYGVTKLAGERAVLTSGAKAIVVRTSWVYSAMGKNFVRAMLNADRNPLTVVADQRGCPTAAPELARILLAIAAAVQSGWSDDYAGIFHSAGDGDTTWHEFAEAIFDEAAKYGAKRPIVQPVTTAEYRATKAKRPANSCLDCTKLHRVFGLRQPPWRDSLASVVAQLIKPSEAPA